MKLILPITFTAAMLTSSTVPETPPADYNAGTTYALGDLVATGTVGQLITVWKSLQAANTGHTPASSPTWWAEIGTTYAAYNAGTTYALGDRVIDAASHLVYESVQAGNLGKALTSTAWWLEAGPTNKWAPFDSYTSTTATGKTSLTYVLAPGYINAVGLYGLVGTQLDATLKDAPGGATVWSYSGDLSEPPAGWYEYLFSPLRPITKKVFSGLPIRPTAELTITISAAAGEPVALGLITMGDYRSLLGDTSTFGGTEAGASAEPVTYSYINTADDGTTTIVRRHKATSMRASVVLPQAQADEALRLVQEVLDVPVAWVGTDADGYAGLNVFGLGSGRLVYESATASRLEINVKGMI